MSKKQNGYQDVNEPSFLVCRTRMLNSLCLHDLGAETLISDVYFSSFDLYFIVKSKMAVVLHIYA